MELVKLRCCMYESPELQCQDIIQLPTIYHEKIYLVDTGTMPMQPNTCVVLSNKKYKSIKQKIQTVNPKVHLSFGLKIFYSLSC